MRGRPLRAAPATALRSVCGFVGLIVFVYPLLDCGRQDEVRQPSIHSGSTYADRASSASTAPSAARIDAALVHDRFERAFSAEAADPAWSGRAQRSSLDRLATSLPEGSRVRSLECRETMCRIETSHTNVEHEQAFFRDAFMNPAKALWPAAVFSSRINDDTPGAEVVTVAYLAREGKSLPSAP